jgi:NAD(P)-dependent dehydrogenase (short-subunit alcohol dehydrogenase family)
MHIEDKVILITGASRGLGEALALACAKKGARLALAARDMKLLKEVGKKAAALGSPHVEFYRLDVVREEDVRAVIKAVGRDFGQIDILVNNAGIHMLAAVADIPEPMFGQLLLINLIGPLRLIKAVLPLMRRRGKGLIVQISTMLSERSLPQGGAYSASKAALDRLTEALRVEVKADGIRVLNVLPGVVDTEIRKNALRIKSLKPEAAERPFARSAEKTAALILAGIEKDRREVYTAAWPVWFFMRILNRLSPGLIDWIFARRAARPEQD